MYAIHLKTKNDANGNPRRLFLICDTHGPVAAVPEGYEGSGAIKSAGFPDMPIAWDVEITPGEYRRQQKRAPRDKGPRSAELAAAHKQYAGDFKRYRRR
jgi:hypothetical protein